MKWVHDLVDLVVLDYRVHVRASLYNLQTRRKYLDEYFEEIPPDNVTPLDIAGYKLWRRNKHNAAESTVNHELCWLRRGFALGKEQGWVEEVPKIQAYRIGNRNARSDFIPIEVLPDLLAELPGDGSCHGQERLPPSCPGARTPAARRLIWSFIAMENASRHSGAPGNPPPIASDSRASFSTQREGRSLQMLCKSHRRRLSWSFLAT